MKGYSIITLFLALLLLVPVVFAEESVEFPRTFVPQQIDLSDWPQIEPLYQKLVDREIASSAELEQWLLDRSELASCLGEEFERRYIAMSCHTDDPELEAQYVQFLEEIEPKMIPYLQKLNQKYYDSPHRDSLDTNRYLILNRMIETGIELYREANIPLQTEDSLQQQNYQKISGAMTAEFDGEEKTLPQLEMILEETDRARRQEAWEKMVNRRLQDREALDQLYDDMIRIRTAIAQNAGFADYREYIFKEKLRFDYTPEDCERFHAAIEKCVVPLSRKLAAQRQKDLGVDPLRPWDMGVDPQGGSPLKPFQTVDELKSGARTILDRLNPFFSAMFDTMDRLGNLDLDNRKGKAPGAYCSFLSEIRQPFLFLNATGTYENVSILLHESGHAVHFVASRLDPLYEYRLNIPLEFAEVASMSMELFKLDYLDVFFSSEDKIRAKRKELESIIDFLPWMARVDAFQHWVYTHPNHTHEERSQQWLDLEARFDARTDWSGYEEAKAAEWHRKLHFFEAPFYYIEYGIAQLGALQIWNNYKNNPPKALDDYLAALELGASRPLPELFQTAGAKFDLSEEILQPLMDMLEEELDRLSESTVRIAPILKAQ